MLMKTVAVIPAAGAGKRMGNETSKQYLSLGAVPIVVRTLRVFAASPSIDGIILVVPAGDVEEVRGAIVEGFGIGKVEKIVAGGRQRQDSVKAGIDALPGGTEVVVIHDGVRPLVTEGLIALCVDGARQFGAASLGVPLKDTVKSLRPDGWVEQTVDRSKLWLTQTPQAFRREIIQEAYRRAYRESFYGTDDASLVERMGVRVKMIPGEERNIKITTAEDLLIAEALLAASRQASG